MNWPPLSILRNALLSYVRHAVPKSTHVLGHIFYLDSKDALGLSLRGIYEPFETQIFRKELRPGDIVLDIGAHIGYFSLLAAELVKDAGHVYAFEPDPANCKLLRRNISVNHFRNVSVYECVVSDKAGKGKLYLWPKGSAGHESYDAKDGRTREVIDVDTVALDQLLKDLPAVDFVKMDINGGEGLAIEGMVHLLQRSRSVKLVMEFNPEFIPLTGADPAHLIKTLRQLGFDIYGLNEKARRKDRLTDDVLLTRFASFEGRDLFCVKSDM